eukprot:6531892-Alexandrium_andersonii.AAC.1
MLSARLLLDVREDRIDLVVPLREAGTPPRELWDLLLLWMYAKTQEDGGAPHAARARDRVAQEVAVQRPVLLLGHVE